MLFEVVWDGSQTSLKTAAELAKFESRVVLDGSQTSGAGLPVKGQGVYRTASWREDMPPWGAAFTLAGQSTEHAEHRGAGVIRPLCLSGERYGLG